MPLLVFKMLISLAVYLVTRSLVQLRILTHNIQETLEFILLTVSFIANCSRAIHSQASAHVIVTNSDFFDIAATV